MKYFCAAAGLIVWVQALAADEKSVTVPFPSAGDRLTQSVLYCDATVGTDLDGTSKKQLEAFPSLTSRGPGLIARAYSRLTA